LSNSNLENLSTVITSLRQKPNKLIYSALNLTIKYTKESVTMTGINSIKKGHKNKNDSIN
jgi:hypothetical protein